MKSKIYALIALLLIILFPEQGMAQFDVLEQRLQGKQRYDEINVTVQQFLAEMPESYEKQRFAKRYARWAWFWSSHLGPEGEFVNVSQRTLLASQSFSDLPQTSANGDWTFIGPSNSTIANPLASYNGLGRVDRIAFHPSNSNIFYIGTTAGGLWRTTDGGTTWEPLSDYIPSLGISGIVVDHSDPNTIFILTGDGDSDLPNGFVFLAGYIRKSVGVWVSRDGGINWEATGTMSTADFVGYQLRQHPTDANILIAATSDGIYRTINHGDTWVQERAGRHYDVEFKPGTPATVYATAPGAFVYSTNTGDTWNTDATFDHALCSNGRVEIAVTPATGAANKVYLLAGPGNAASNTFCGFYLSTNSGSSFTRTCTSPNILGTETGGGGDQSRYDMALAVHPSNDQVIIAGGLVTFKSTNGGSTFSYLSTYNENGGKYIHPDIHGIGYNPLNNYLWVVGDGGVHRSINDGANWTDMYAGVCVTQFYYMTDFDGNANALLGGCQDNGVKYRTTATTNFSHVMGADGYDGIIDYTDQTKGYAVINYSLEKYSNFIGVSPSTVRNGGFFMQVEMNTANHDIVYMGDDLVYSYNASSGVTTPMSTTARGHWALKTCPGNSNRIYSAGGSYCFAPYGDMFTYDGTSWDTISGNPGFPATYPRITDIGVNPTASSQVYASFAGYTEGVKIVYSADAGLNWTNISYDLPNLPVNAIEVDNGNNVYVGCDIGVYYKANGSSHWEPFSNNLPQTPVTDLAINTSADQLLASTFGRGIWRSSLFNACPATMNITNNVSGQYYGKASNSITISGQVIGGTETDVRLRSEGYVDLTPGFQADATPGNQFHAYIGSCTTPFPMVSAPGVISVDSALSGCHWGGSGEKGTLEITGKGDLRQIKLRTYASGKIRIVLGDPMGMAVKEIIAFEAPAGERTIDLPVTDLKPGLYRLFLTVNGRIEHLQELNLQ